MNGDLPAVAPARPRTRPLVLAEFALPLFVATWRLTWYAPAKAWTDWVLLVAIFWMFSIVVKNRPLRSRVTVSLCVALFAIYLYAQLEHIAGEWWLL